MADLIVSNLFEASFRGQKFYLNTSSTVSGGQKLAIYDYANSDRRDIFYMGDKPNEYSLKALVYPESEVVAEVGASLITDPNFAIPTIASNVQSAARSGDYFRYRNAFINALKEKGKGRLVHPFYGNIDCYVESWSATEDITNLGVIEFDITFKVDVLPLQEQFGASTREAIDEIIERDLLPTLKSELSLPPKSPVYLNKLLGFINVIQTAITFVKNVDILGFASLIAGRNLRPFFVTPIAIYNLLRGIFRTIGRNKTLPSDTKTFAVEVRSFNDALQPQFVNYTTQNALEYNRNLQIFKSTTEILTLDTLYQYAIENGFESISDLEDYKSVTDDIFKNFRNNCPSEGLIKIGEAIKEKFTLFLQEQALTTLRVVEVNIPGEPLDVLLYRYYEDFSFRNRIIRLNNIKDTSWVEGKVRLLTK
jgi:hypothetical protein